MPDYDFTEVLIDLDGGLVASKLSRIVCAVALGVVEHGRDGKVLLELKMQRLGESSQLEVTHKVAFVKPTLRGKATEEDATSTIMYVGQGGAVTVMPESQGKFDFQHTDGTRGD